jgi:HSP20 family protein
MNDKKNSCSVQSQAPVTRRYGLATPFDDIFSGMFDDFFKITPARRGFEKPLNFQPKLNIQETENDYVVKLEVPGMKESDFDITLSDNVLTLKGHKSQDYDEKEGNMHYVGRSYGSFEQSIPINVEINEDAVSATAEQGILTIKLPKKEPSKDRTRKISVKSL